MELAPLVDENHIVLVSRKSALEKVHGTSLLCHLGEREHV